MRLSLDSATQASLLDMPETGMGFQHVVASYMGKPAEFLVFNSETALQLSDLRLRDGTDQSVIEDNGLRVMRALQDSLSNHVIIAPCDRRGLGS